MNRTVRTKHVELLACLLLLLPWLSACSESEAMNACFIGGGVAAAGGCDTQQDQEASVASPGDLDLFKNSINQAISNQFLTGSAYTLCKVAVQIKRNNDTAQAMTISAEIWSDDGADLPSAKVGDTCNNTVTRTDDLTTSYQDITFEWTAGTKPVLADSTYYHVVLWSDTVNSSNYVAWLRAGAASGASSNEQISKATVGTWTWSAESATIGALFTSYSE